MTETPIAVLEKAAHLGLRLKAVGNDLHVKPGRCCPTEFADTLRAYKSNLLALLALPFVMVDSEAIGETIFFCEDEDTKAALVEAGASPWSIYPKAELHQFVQQNRIAPFSDAELRKLHEIKRTFKTTMTE